MRTLAYCNLNISHNYYIIIVGDYTMKYFYAWGQLFVLPFTIYFYIKASKAERIKMVLFGFFFGILGVILGYASYLDYFRPQYLIPELHIKGISPTVFCLRDCYLSYILFLVKTSLKDKKC